METIHVDYEGIHLDGEQTGYQVLEDVIDKAIQNQESKEGKKSKQEENEEWEKKLHDMPRKPRESWVRGGSHFVHFARMKELNTLEARVEKNGKVEVPEFWAGRSPRQTTPKVVLRGDVPPFVILPGFGGD